VKVYMVFCLTLGMFLAVPALAGGNGPPACHPVFGCEGGEGGDGGSAEQDQGQGQLQGQQQGQVGIVSGGDVDTSTTTDTSTSTSTSTSNEAVGSGNETQVDARDQSTTLYEAQKRNPVMSAAPVFASACSRGASGQGIGMGGAIAFTNEMCDLALAAELAARVGNTELQDMLIERAAKLAMARGNKFRIWLQYIPIIGQFM
jgi:hypothetical protein